MPPPKQPIRDRDLLVDTAMWNLGLKEDNKRIRWITRQKCGELLTHLKATIRFSLARGLREANVTGLQWSQIDMQRRCA